MGSRHDSHCVAITQPPASKPVHRSMHFKGCCFVEPTSSFCIPNLKQKVSGSPKIINEKIPLTPTIERQFATILLQFPSLHTTQMLRQQAIRHIKTKVTILHIPISPLLTHLNMKIKGRISP